MPVQEELIELEKIFYNPKTGYVNVNQLIKLATENKLYYLTPSIIKKWYKEQSVNQVYHEKRSKNFTPIVSPWSQVGVLQADLMFTDKFSRHNKDPKNQKSYSYILAIIDVYSRYAWAFPLMYKSAKEVASHVSEVLKEIKQKHSKNTLTFTSDYGSEFLGETKKLLKSERVAQFLLDPKDDKSLNKKGIIERFNRTLWNKLKKYMAKSQTLRYFDVLPDLIFNYNNTVHSTIKCKPIEVFQGLKKPFIKDTEITSSDLKIGDKVRRLLKRKLFDKKSFEPIFSTIVYEISGQNGNAFYLKNVENGNVLKSTYLPRQLLKIDKGEDLSTFRTMKEENTRKNQFVQKIRKEGLEVEKESAKVIIPKRLQPTREKRQVKPVVRLNYDKMGSPSSEPKKRIKAKRRNKPVTKKKKVIVRRIIRRVKKKLGTTDMP